MKLQTQGYLPVVARDAVDPRIGLPDLRKGLNSILLGYLLIVGSIAGAVGIVLFLAFQAKAGQLSRTEMENAGLVVFTLLLLLPLAGIASLTLIVRGKWLCLASAPEGYHAKWMMFLSIMCIVAGPLLNLGVNLVGDDGPKSPQGRMGYSTSLARVQKEIDAFKHGMPELSTRFYVKLVGQGIGMLSGVFFVLFLRAVALCWDAPIRARFAELYLVFMAVLVAGVVVLIRNPNYMMKHPELLLGLGAGWLLAGPWYLGLILSTSIGITFVLARGSREGEHTLIPSRDAKVAPPQKTAITKRERAQSFSPLQLD